MSKAITKVNSNRKALASILNCTNEILKIRFISIDLEAISDNQIKVLWNQNLHKNDFEKFYQRIQKLKNKLKLGHLNSEEYDFIFKICKEYNDIFHLDGDYLSQTDISDHEIQLTDYKPINIKNYRQPETLKKEIDTQIEKILKQKIIRLSVSPYNAPLWIVPKKTDASGKQKWRIVIDYRKLNEITVGSSFPIPNIEEIL